MTSNTGTTLLSCFTDAVRARGSSPFLHFSGTQLSYSRLDEASNAFAAGLASQGVLCGDRVAIALPNCPQLLVAEVGAWKAGTAVCPFNPTHPLRETQEVLAATGAQTVVVLDRFYDRIKAVQSRTAVRRVITVNLTDDFPPAHRLAFALLRDGSARVQIDGAAGDMRMTDMLAAHPYAWPPAIGVYPDFPAVILMDSSTARGAREVVHTHGRMFTAGLALRGLLRSVIPERDVMLLAMPLFHGFDHTGVQGLAFVNDNPIALVANPHDLTELLKAMKRVRPSFIAAMPAVLSGLMDHARSGDGQMDFRSIKLTFSGAPLLASTRQRWEALTGGFFLEDYGDEWSGRTTYTTHGATEVSLIHS